MAVILRPTAAGMYERAAAPSGASGGLNERCHLLPRFPATVSWELQIQNSQMTGFARACLLNPHISRHITGSGCSTPDFLSSPPLYSLLSLPLPSTSVHTCVVLCVCVCLSVSDFNSKGGSCWLLGFHGDYRHLLEAPCRDLLTVSLLQRISSLGGISLLFIDFSLFVVGNEDSKRLREQRML